MMTDSVSFMTGESALKVPERVGETADAMDVRSAGDIKGAV